MTNEKVIQEYDRFLREYVGCYTDENGNRPCDYGRPCEKCMTDDMQYIWLRILHYDVERRFFGVTKKY